MLDALTHYIEFVQEFEELAANESNPELKAQLEGQADAYRKLAAKRAQELGLASTQSPSGSLLRLILITAPPATNYKALLGLSPTVIFCRRLGVVTRPWANAT